MASKCAISSEVRRSLVPKEQLQRIIRSRGLVTSNKFKCDKRITLGALKYLPHSVYKLLENIPMPWCASEIVHIQFHLSGSISLVEDVSRVIHPIFIAQWSTMWITMRREKRDRIFFKRMRYP